jgi:hypothetical protein
MKWQTIESAPRDGTRIRLRNDNNGLEDTGYWLDYSHVPAEERLHWPPWMEGQDGEWSTEYGNGEMTHWTPLPPATGGRQ